MTNLKTVFNVWYNLLSYQRQQMDEMLTVAEDDLKNIVHLTDILYLEETLDNIERHIDKALSEIEDFVRYCEKIEDKAGDKE